jgi:putative hemolysin
MTPLRKGTYWTSIAVSPAELEVAQCLRAKAFNTGPKGAQIEPVDRDCYDQGCAHMVIKDASSGGLVCCFRLLLIFDNTTIAQSYSAQYYDLSGLQSYPHPMLEVGRFCIDPAAYDGDILRLAWTALIPSGVNADTRWGFPKAGKSESMAAYLGERSDGCSNRITVGF